MIDEIDRLGLRRSTVVVFSSDNGFNAGHHGIWGKGNGTWPLNMYDSSVKVPTIFTQPGRIPAGTVRPDLLSAYDMAATLLELVGLDPMPMQAGPGRSFAPLVLGRDSGKESQENDVASVVVFDEYGPARMIRTSEWKYVHRWPDGPDELYHLREDPLEERNLVDDPEIASVRRRMSDDLAAWFAKHTRPLNDGHRLAVIGTGQAGRAGDADAFQGPLWDSTYQERKVEESGR